MTLSDLVGRGWVSVEPPLDRDESSVVARYKGRPLKAGFMIEDKSDDDELHVKYRSGRYDLEVKIDFEVVRGQAKVEEADGYE